MTLAFWDSSAILKLLVDEVGSDEAERVWNEPTPATASRLVIPEVSAALSAARRAGRLDRASHDAVIRQWRRYRTEVDLVELTAGLAEHAAVLAAEHHLSGADAVHLASALSLGPASSVVVTWDRRLAAAGAAAGLTVVPALA